MCYGKKRGLGRCISQSFLLRLEERRSICQRLVIAFKLGDHAPTSHTPRPLSRGEVGDAIFYLIIRYLVYKIPLSRGDKGVCDDEKRGLGKAIAGSCLMRCLVLRGSSCQASVSIFVLGGCAQA